MDFYAIQTAAGVAGKYQYNIDYMFAAGCVAAAAGITISFLMPDISAERHYWNKKPCLASLAGIVVSVLFIVWINFDTYFFRGVSSVTWDHNIGINDYGYLLYFVANAGKAEVDEPAGYSAEEAGRILSAYNNDDKYNRSNVQNPNIIMIMNESFSDCVSWVIWKLIKMYCLSMTALRKIQ